MIDVTKEYQAGSAGNAEVRREGTGWTLVFVRKLSHPPERVWEALTDPERLADWAPFDPSRNLGTTGAATLTMAGGTAADTMDCIVRHADRPRLLEYTWGDDVLRWELEGIDIGTRLTLSHTVGDPDWLPRVAAGWQICFDVADRALSGVPIGRIVGDDARRVGWERLNTEFAQRFGVTDAGWPQ